MNFKPFGDRVLVKVKEAKNQTESGIILPDNASKERPNEGEIVAIGGSPKGLEVGDSVMFGQYAGTEVSVEGENYLILETYKDIIGVIKKA